MLSNSVASGFETPDRIVITGSVDQTYPTTTGKPGLLSVSILATVDTHIAKGVSSTSKFLLLANTYMEIPVADLEDFHFFGTAAGFLYVIEWRG